jgi:hypothetical protein
MTRRHRKDHDLMGLEADDLLSTFDNLREEDIWQYRYPNFQEIRENSIKGIYLGNYLRWDPIMQHRKMVELYDYKTAPLNRTFDIYDHVDDLHYADTHDFIKTRKHGYGKATDHACREIRYGRLTRAEGELLSKYYREKKLEHTQELLNWLGLSQESFEMVVKMKTQKKYSDETTKGEKGRETSKSNNSVDPGLIVSNLMGNPNTNIFDNSERRTITIGKGYANTN